MPRRERIYTYNKDDTRGLGVYEAHLNVVNNSRRSAIARLSNTLPVLVHKRREDEKSSRDNAGFFHQVSYEEIKDLLNRKKNKYAGLTISDAANIRLFLQKFKQEDIECDSTKKWVTKTKKELDQDASDRNRKYYFNEDDALTIKVVAAMLPNTYEHSAKISSITFLSGEVPKKHGGKLLSEVTRDEVQKLRLKRRHKSVVKDFITLKERYQERGESLLGPQEAVPPPWETQNDWEESFIHPEADAPRISVASSASPGSSGHDVLGFPNLHYSGASRGNPWDRSLEPGRSGANSSGSDAEISYEIPTYVGLRQQWNEQGAPSGPGGSRGGSSR